MIGNKSEMDKIIEGTFSEYGYPEDFLAEYDQLECLSGRSGRETFLCKKKGSEELVVAKCFSGAFYDNAVEEPVVREYDVPGIPHFIKSYRNDSYVCVIREYIPGKPLSEVVKERDLTQDEILEICGKLGDILIRLHSQEPQIVHRDIKPENVILKEDGSVFLIDLDIARTVKPEGDSDTYFFGTKGYAPPEQYGFSQTDERADIYSFGVLLRFLITGSIRENKNIKIYRPIEKIITRCTAFSPEKRYPNMKAVKRDLSAINPRSIMLRKIGIGAAVLCVCAAISFGSIRLYQYLTYSPFGEGSVPGYVSDDEKVRQAVAYMEDKYGTDLFQDPDDFATVGFLRTILVELYGFEPDYVWGMNDDMPRESEEFFLPWGFEDSRFLDRDIAVYAAVKLHDPAIVADWSELRDDNGYYPGVRVAEAFAKKNGIMEGVNKPRDITKGETALILYNAELTFSGKDQG